MSKGTLLQTLPNPGDAFYLIVAFDVVLVRAGGKLVRTPLVHVDGIAAGPDGVVLARVIGKQPRPLLVAWWPTTNRLVHAKHAVFGTAQATTSCGCTRRSARTSTPSSTEKIAPERALSEALHGRLGGE